MDVHPWCQTQSPCGRISKRKAPNLQRRSCVHAQGTVAPRTAASLACAPAIATPETSSAVGDGSTGVSDGGCLRHGRSPLAPLFASSLEGAREVAYASRDSLAAPPDVGWRLLPTVPDAAPRSRWALDWACGGGAKTRMRSAAPGLGDRCRAVRRTPLRPQPWASHLLTPFRSRAIAPKPWAAGTRTTLCCRRERQLGEARPMRQRGSDQAIRDIAIRDSADSPW